MRRKRKGASIHTIEAPVFSLVFAVLALTLGRKVHKDPKQPGGHKSRYRQGEDPRRRDVADGRPLQPGPVRHHRARNTAGQDVRGRYRQTIIDRAQDRGGRDQFRRRTLRIGQMLLADTLAASRCGFAFLILTPEAAVPHSARSGHRRSASEGRDGSSGMRPSRPVPACDSVLESRRHAGVTP